MIAGVSTATYFGRLCNEDAVKSLAKMNVKAAEVFLTSFSEYDRAFGEIVAKNKGDLPVHSVHVLNTQFEPQLFSDHPRVKADCFLWLEKAMSAAQAFGAKYYTFHGIARYKKSALFGKNDNFVRWGQGLNEIAQTCQKYGVMPALENVEWSTCNRPEVFEILSNICPWLCGVLDVKQARLSGYPVEEYIRVMQGKIAHVHVSDVDERGKICLPGFGKTDFDELLKRLNGAGFDGPLLIEVYKDDFQGEDQLLQSLEFLQEKADKYSL
jgi:sugar phosphate isomerase/epimerase